MKFSYHYRPESNNHCIIEKFFSEEFGDSESVARTISYEWKPVFLKQMIQVCDILQK